MVCSPNPSYEERQGDENDGPLDQRPSNVGKFTSKVGVSLLAFSVIYPHNERIRYHVHASPVSKLTQVFS